MEYWNRRNDPNNPLGWDPSILREHIEYVRGHIGNCTKILDFGPGVGRMLSAYSKWVRVEGFDISDKYASRLRERAREKQLQFGLTVHKTVDILPFGDKEFDASVCVSVLLHQLPSDISFIMNQLARVSERVIVITHQSLLFPFEALDEEKHCYNHDYLNLLMIGEYVLHDWQYNIKNGQLYFTYSDREDTP